MENVTAIPNLPPFIPDDDTTSVAQRWKRWSDRFDNLMTAMNITDNNRKKALLLHLAGESVYDVFQGLIVPDVAEDADPAEDNVYLRAKRALDAHFDPQRNTEFEVYNFRKTQQMQGELIDSYHSRLRAMTKYCQFTNVDNEIKSHIIQTCTSTRLRRKALTEPHLTLNQLIDIGRAMETSERQLRSIEGATPRLTIADNQPVAAIRRAAGPNRRQPTATLRPPPSSTIVDYLPELWRTVPTSRWPFNMPSLRHHLQFVFSKRSLLASLSQSTRESTNWNHYTSSTPRPIIHAPTTSRSPTT